MHLSQIVTTQAEIFPPGCCLRLDWSYFVRKVYICLRGISSRVVQSLLMCLNDTQGGEDMGEAGENTNANQWVQLCWDGAKLKAKGSCREASMISCFVFFVHSNWKSDPSLSGHVWLHFPGCKLQYSLSDLSVIIPSKLQLVLTLLLWNTLLSRGVILPPPSITYAFPCSWKAKSFHYCVAEKVLWVEAAKGVCLTWKGQQVWLQVPVFGAWAELVSRRNVGTLASLFSLFILIRKSIEARYCSEIPATIPWISGTRSGAEWSPMAPSSCFSSMSQPSTSQQRGYRDLRSGDTGLTNIEGVAVEKMLVWPTRAVGLLCWDALLWAMDSDYSKGREDFMCWEGWPGKAKSLVNGVPMGRPYFCKSLRYLEEVAS